MVVVGEGLGNNGELVQRLEEKVEEKKTVGGSFVNKSRIKNN